MIGHIHYGLSHVLQGVSIRVAAGEVVGLFGRNRVGKTTVMKTIAGWLTPSEGRVTFDGQEIGGRGLGRDLPPRHWFCARGPAHLSRAHGGRKPGAGFHAMPKPLGCRIETPA